MCSTNEDGTISPCADLQLYLEEAIRAHHHSTTMCVYDSDTNTAVEIENPAYFGHPDSGHFSECKTCAERGVRGV